MTKVETALSLEQILEGIGHLNESEKRTLAAAVLADPRLESFVEELEDNLSVEQANKEGSPQPFPLRNSHQNDFAPDGAKRVFVEFRVVSWIVPYDRAVRSTNRHEAARKNANGDFVQRLL